MLFIIVQKMARLLVIPKNITRGLNRPQLVQKAVFYLSLGLICMLLKPQWTSSLVKYLAPQSCNTSSKMRSKKYLFFTVMELRAQQSCTNQRELSFFLMKNTGAAIDNLDGHIHSVHKFSYKKISSSFCSMGESITNGHLLIAQTTTIIYSRTIYLRINLRLNNIFYHLSNFAFLSLLITKSANHKLVSGHL